ncbi:MAG: hypothetical protein ACXWP5_03830 [Bdellovibrionota bacterium]
MRLEKTLRLSLMIFGALSGSCGIGINGLNRVTPPSPSPSPSPCTPPASSSQTFNFTGAVQTFTVPACVTKLTISAAAGMGASGGGTCGAGDGAKISSVQFTVNAGDVLNVVVGGQGGGSAAGGGGGGGTSVFDTTSSTLLVLMGGGGGAPWNVGSCVAPGCTGSTTTTANNCGGQDLQNMILNGNAGSAGTCTGTCAGTTSPGGGGGSFSTAGTNAGGSGANGGGGGFGAAGGAASTFAGGAIGGFGAGGGGGGGQNSGGGGGGFQGGGGGNSAGTTGTSGGNGAPGGGGGSFCSVSCTITATNVGNGSVTIAY